MSDIHNTYACREQTFLACMPNLAFTGLSENWLLKECGHQHWLALAQLHDRPLPDFRDDTGRIAYAAFTAVRCWDMALPSVAENRSFNIHTRITRSGMARHFSEHTVNLGAQVVARLALLSTFVSRHLPGDNRSVTKARLASSKAPGIAPPMQQQLQSDNRRLRAGDWESHHRLRREHCVLAGTFDYTPCPDADYNGAGFLYFANFQAIVDRAEWALLGLRRLGHTTARELHYYANLNVGDGVRVELHTGCSSDRSAHWCQIYRRSDNTCLADIFTAKAYPSNCSRP